MSKADVITLLFCLTMLVCPGCGGSDRPELVVVSGKITMDGKPLQGAQVALKYISDDPDNTYGRPSRAFTDAEGVFKPVAYGDADGIPVGKYRVAVIKQDIPDNYNAEDPSSVPVNIKWITPRYYSDIDASGLEIDVTADGIVPEVIDLGSIGAGEIENTVRQNNYNDP